MYAVVRSPIASRGPIAAAGFRSDPGGKPVTRCPADAQVPHDDRGSRVRDGRAGQDAKAAALPSTTVLCTHGAVMKFHV